MALNDSLQITQEGIDLIKNAESLQLKTYLCPAGIPTIGWGHTGPEVKLGMTIDIGKAMDYLYRDIEAAAKVIREKVKTQLNANQFSALISFIFNLGAGNFITSTLLKKINQGDFANAAMEFPRWNHNAADGKVLDGLTRRRLAEKALFQKA